MRVEVYRNLHTGTLSVRATQGRVIDHPMAIGIRKPSFVVQPAGRAKVLREKRKNVHAFVRGTLSQDDPNDLLSQGEWRMAKYNPYRADTFTDAETGKSVLFANYAVVTTDGVHYR